MEIDVKACKERNLPVSDVVVSAMLFKEADARLARGDIDAPWEIVKAAYVEKGVGDWCAPTEVMAYLMDGNGKLARQADERARPYVACWGAQLQERYETNRPMLQNSLIPPRLRPDPVCHDRNIIRLCSEEVWYARREREPDVDRGKSNPFDRLKGLSGIKLLAKPTLRMFDGLDELARQQPNFAHVVEQVRLSLHARWLVAAPLKLPPLLLYGAPGTGKTRFAKTLAYALGVEVCEIPFAGMSDVLQITGLGQHWSTRGPGRVAQFMADCDIGNPMFVFDEIDKSGQSSHGNPHDALLHLLEEETARVFRDEYAELAIDASYVSVIATANSIAHLPQPLLNRFMCLEILPPDAAGRRVVAATAYAELREDEPYGKLFSEQPCAEVLELIAQQLETGRDIKQAVRSGMQRACLNLQQGGVSAGSLILLPEHFVETRARARRFGFAG